MNRIIVVLSLFMMISGGAYGGERVVSGKVFALMDTSDNLETINNFLEMREVDGIVLRINWADLEPKYRRYNWEALDNVLEAVKVWRKKVTLRIVTDSPSFPPSWLSGQGVMFYVPKPNKINNRPTPVPWDMVFLKRWSEFNLAMSRHIKATGAINVVDNVTITAPVFDISIAGCKSSVISNRPKIPYSRENYAYAWKSSIYALHLAFPRIRKIISVPAGEICKKNSGGEKVYRALLYYLESLENRRFMILARDLRANGSKNFDALPKKDKNYQVAMQFIGSYSKDKKKFLKGGLMSAVCKAYGSYGTRYFEVYKDDLLNSTDEVRTAIARIHKLEKCKKSRKKK